MKNTKQKIAYELPFRKSYLIFLLLVIASCGDNGNGKSSNTFQYTVMLGDAPQVNGQPQRAPGATIKVYTSGQAWFDGTAPLKTLTVDANGQVESADKFTLGNVVLAESGTLNNWPNFLFNPTLNEDPNLPGRLTGGVQIYDSFLSLFEGVSGKSFILSDVKLNGNSIFSNVSACSKDNFIKLQKNTKILVSEGASICSGQVASEEFTLIIPYTKSLATTRVINATTLYEFSCNWTNAEGKVYVKPDFTQVWISTYGGTANQTVSIYTKQP